MAAISLLPLLAFILLLNTRLERADAKNLGICYGFQANNLPPPEKSVRLFDVYKFGRMRIYAPDHNVLRALSGSNVQLTVGIPNHKVGDIAANLSEAENWFHTNIKPYIGHVWFRNFVVGHANVISENSTKVVLQAMTNLHTVVSNHGLQNTIRVTTEVGRNALGAYNLSSSQGSFKRSSRSGLLMEPIVKFLASHNAPLFIVNYPHIFYMSDASYRTAEPMNIFLGIIDVFYSAMEKVGGKDVKVVVGETGWPWAGENKAANVANAKDYVWNLSEHVLSKNGTAMRPGGQIETYVYALFDENLRGGAWKNFGMFYPNMTAVYPIPPLQ